MRDSKDELISDVLLWTPTLGHQFWSILKNHIYQFALIWLRLDDMPKSIADSDRWRKKVEVIFAFSAP